MRDRETLPDASATLSSESAALRDGWLDAAGRVAIDARCHRCGYNLRTIAVDSSCPECGLAAAESAPLATREPARLFGVRNACFALVAAMAVAILLNHSTARLVQHFFKPDIQRYMAVYNASPGQLILVDPGQPWTNVASHSVYLLGVVLVALAHGRFDRQIGEGLSSHIRYRKWRWIGMAAIVAAISWIAFHWIWTLGGGRAFGWMALFTECFLTPLFLVAAAVVIRRCGRLIHNAARRPIGRSVRVVAAATYLLAAVVMTHHAVMTACQISLIPEPRPGFIDMTRMSGSPKYSYLDHLGNLVITSTFPADLVSGNTSRLAQFDRAVRNPLLRLALRFVEWITPLNYCIAGASGALLLMSAVICHRAARSGLNARAALAAVGNAPTASATPESQSPHEPRRPGRDAEA